MPKINLSELRKKFEEDIPFDLQEILQPDNFTKIEELVNKRLDRQDYTKFKKAPKEDNTGLKNSIIFLKDNDGEVMPYLIGKEIKKGGKAVLKNAYNLVTGEHVALKVVRDIKDETRNEQKNEHDKEYLSLNFFNRFKGVNAVDENNPNKLYLAQQVIVGKDLSDYLSNIQDSMQSYNIRECPKHVVPSITTVFAKFLEQVVYLHEDRFIHRDIKPLNAMIDNDSNCFLIDFGSCDKNEIPTYNLSGSPHYMAPELQEDENGNILFTQKSDIFAVGKTLEEFIACFKQGKMALTYEIYPNIKEKLSDLTNKMKNEDPSVRPNAREAYLILKEILNEHRILIADLKKPKENIQSPRKK